ncbi:hypothetical protein [Streptomyces sp. NPDC051909]|uniref:hypothetical protein n=1 Tax=Streptomyces sp. NPDC051909 TaxID=3154944 RepID=UPI003432EE66
MAMLETILATVSGLGGAGLGAAGTLQRRAADPERYDEQLQGELKEFTNRPFPFRAAVRAAPTGPSTGGTDPDRDDVW